MCSSGHILQSKHYRMEFIFFPFFIPRLDVCIPNFLVNRKKNYPSLSQSSPHSIRPSIVYNLVLFTLSNIWFHKHQLTNQFKSQIGYERPGDNRRKKKKIK